MANPFRWLTGTAGRIVNAISALNPLPAIQTAVRKFGNWLVGAEATQPIPPDIQPPSPIQQDIGEIDVSTLSELIGEGISEIDSIISIGPPELGVFRNDRFHVFPYATEADLDAHIQATIDYWNAKYEARTGMRAYLIKRKWRTR